MVTGRLDKFPCQPGCAACCIAPAISSPIPGMPQGKPAGERCIQLDAHLNCKLFGLPERPQVCLQFMPARALCGQGRDHALMLLAELEEGTRP